MSERSIALGFLALSGVYLALSFAFPFGTAAKPGAGFFPVGVGVFLCVVAAIFVGAVWRGRAVVARWSAEPLAGDAALRVGVGAAALVGFVLALPWTGYPLAAFLFVVSLLRGFGARGWLVPLVAGAVGAALSWYVFAVLLAVPLPKGLLAD